MSIVARCADVASQRSRIYGCSRDPYLAVRRVDQGRESIYGYMAAIGPPRGHRLDQGVGPYMKYWGKIPTYVR
jgi:hypothetical protein